MRVSVRAFTLAERGTPSRRDSSPKNHVHVVPGHAFLDDRLVLGEAPFDQERRDRLEVFVADGGEERDRPQRLDDFLAAP
jgi:hypothetical protein